MGKQQKNKKPVHSPNTCSNVGRGKVTPLQVAFIVDRYLFDNHYMKSRATFRSEASSVIFKSPLHQAPEGLLSLDAMLNEYISLKEEKVAMDEERVVLDQEKWRIQSLLQGMQDVMNAYNANASGAPHTPAAQGVVTKTMVTNLSAKPNNCSPTGCTVYSTPAVVPQIKCSDPEKTSLQSVLHPTSSKRKHLNDASEATSAAKRTRSMTCSSKQPNKSLGSHAKLDASSVTVQSSIPKNPMDVPSFTGSGVAKRLFNLPSTSSPLKSPGPITPPQEVSSRTGECGISTCVPSIVGCSNNNTPQELTPTRCTVLSYEKVTLSPYKYTIERSHCIASSSPAKTTLKRLNKRDHVKGRLDFDRPCNLDDEIAHVISTSPSQEDNDIFDLEFPDLGALANISFSELLVDLDIHYDNHSDNPTVDTSPETFSGSSNESREINLGLDQFPLESSATVHESISADMPVKDTSKTVESVTRFICSESPSKGQTASSQPENHPAIP